MAAPLAGYVRVSHVGGRSGDSFRSPTEQAGEIRAWAERHNRKVRMLEPELDAKGSDASRPILRQAVEGVRAGEFSGVVVAYLSRAGRDMRLMVNLWSEVEEAGGTFHFARENIDGSTTSGRLQRNLLASIAQHELEERRDGFARSRASAVERGIWRQRQTPLGYSRDKDTRRLVPDGDATAVRRAFVERAGGKDVSAIARSLSMTTSGVRQMLANRVYLGELRDGGNVNLEAHKPLVSVEEFEAVHSGISRPAKHGPPALLAGLARCAGCGHVMPRGGHSKVVAYACARNHSGARCPAPAAVTLHRLDAYVEPIALGELRRLSVTEVDAAGSEHAKQALARAEAELRAYVEAVSAEDVGVEAFAAGAKARRAAINDARQELRRHLARDSLALPEGATVEEVWESLDGHERNTLLRGLLAAVVVKRAGGRGARAPLEDRVRVVAYGADMELPVRRGGAPAGVVPISFDDLDGEGVARVLGREDRL